MNKIGMKKDKLSMLTNVALLVLVVSLSGEATAEEVGKNRFVEVFSAKPISLLDFGMFKITSEMREATWPEGGVLKDVGASVLSSDAILIEAILEADKTSQAHCTEYWAFAKRVLSNHSKLNACSGYTSFFISSELFSSLGAGTASDPTLSPCDITTISILLNDSVGTARTMCSGQFGAETNELSIKSYE